MRAIMVMYDTLCKRTLPNYGDEQAKKLAKMARKTVNDIRNIATVVFTAPVGMSGGYGQTGLKIMMDTLTHTRAGANGAVKIDTKAEFQLPFSIAKDGENTIIKFYSFMMVFSHNIRIFATMKQN